jgi:hypothetical protein
MGIPADPPDRKFYKYMTAETAKKVLNNGHVPKTKGYADCRIELERLRAGAGSVRVKVD